MLDMVGPLEFSDGLARDREDHELIHVSLQMPFEFEIKAELFDSLTELRV